MKINDLLALEPGADLTVVNEPFHFVGKLKLTLMGGEDRYWLFSDNGEMLSIAPEDDEIVLFRETGENLEPEDDMVLYQSEEYEFSYEDHGAVNEVLGTVGGMMEEDKYALSDYESDEATLRIVKNENTDDTKSFLGEVVVHEEILLVS